jgi:hypothetical protein
MVLSNRLAVRLLVTVVLFFAIMVIALSMSEAGAGGGFRMTTWREGIQRGRGEGKAGKITAAFSPPGQEISVSSTGSKSPPLNLEASLPMLNRESACCERFYRNPGL